MLYVKVDASGNPREVAKTSDTIRKEFISAEGTILPATFEDNPDSFGYRQVPFNAPMPDQVAGKNILPDVPTKNADGTYTRTWKYTDIPDFEKIDLNELDIKMRENRKKYMQKFVDSISPLRWESWSDAEKQEIRNWYQSVKDMTKNPNWPKVAFPPLPAPIKDNS